MTANERAKIWYQNNKERKKAYDLEYNKANRDKRNSQSRNWAAANKVKNKEIKKKEYEKNKHKKFLYHANRLKTDLQYKLRCTLRSRLSYIKRNGSSIKDLGCSVKELKHYLETRFEVGMSWNNWSYRGWHIDHIIPLSAFDLTDRSQLLRACHYSNLQPMWGIDNIRKGGKHG